MYPVSIETRCHVFQFEKKSKPWNNNYLGRQDFPKRQANLIRKHFSSNSSQHSTNNFNSHSTLIFLSLHISQLRLPTFCKSEALIGIFDTINDAELAKLLVKTAPPTLLAERTEREANSDYLKYTMLSLLREMKDCQRQSDVHITLCHICKTEDPQENTVSRYLLRIASIGDTKTILCRNFGSLTLSNNANQVSRMNLHQILNFISNILTIKLLFGRSTKIIDNPTAIVIIAINRISFKIFKPLRLAYTNKTNFCCWPVKG